MERKVKADLHNHLRTSSIFRDSDFNKGMDVASKRLGSGGVIGIVNCDDQRYEVISGLRGYNREFVGEQKNGFYVSEKDVLAVKAQEVATEDGDLLVLGLGKDVHVKQHQPLNDTLKEAKDKDGIVVAVHPFAHGGIGEYLLMNPYSLGDLDAIETYNGQVAFGIPKSPFPVGANQKAQKLYDEMKGVFPNLGSLTCSDGHSMWEIGRSWTMIDELNLNPSQFNDSLRNAVRNTDNNTVTQRKNGAVGMIKHIADLAFIIGVAPKIGMADNYKVDRPEGGYR